MKNYMNREGLKQGLRKAGYEWDDIEVLTDFLVVFGDRCINDFKKMYDKRLVMSALISIPITTGLIIGGKYLRKRFKH